MRFHTNIDCMKKFMGRISGLDIQPLVGDLVQVYRDSELIIELAVVERHWTFDPAELNCELYLPNERWESLAHFIKVMRDHHIT